ncbi:MAG TPA: cytochrome-c peroxidase, partial [Bacteroidales bacterium]|nr:cytochrome-c peroxidase [Bacteroidales bacterium]
MKNRILFLITAVVFCTYSCSNSNETAISESAKADSILMANAKSIFGTLPESAFIDTVQMSEAKVKLGKILYFDKRLSKDETQSCNTCHNLATYGVDNLATSKGDNGGFGTRNSPTTFNAALHAFQFWDGRMKDVEEQAGGPILNPVEMAIPNEKFLVDRISKIPMYQELFKAAYPNDAKPIVYKNIQNAIGHFERTLITPTRFDNFLNGDMAALTAEEKKGLETFNKAGCIACHNGP